MAASPWFLCLEGAAQKLLRSADALLARYPRQRRRGQHSVASRVFSTGVKQLREYAVCLNDEEQKQFFDLDRKLQERLQALEQRRIPPFGMGLHRQCRDLQDLSAQEPKGWDFPAVLVGALRRPSQLDICLIHGFYHVPVRQIPEDRPPVDYVAIYQSRSLFQEDCGIRFYGKVKCCTVVRRWQISEIPKASEELYYRFEIDQWKQLEKSIQVREVPFTHMFTNVFLLTHGEETPQLFLNTPAEYRYYQSIKHALLRKDGLVFAHPGGNVWLKNGLLQVRYRGRKLAAFRAEDFSSTPGSVFRQLMDVLKNNAG